MKPTLFIPGPVELSAKTRLAASVQVIPHRGIEMKNVLKELKNGMQEVLGTSSEIYLITGSGTAGVEFLAANLITPRDKTICLSNGKFGSRFHEIASLYSQSTELANAPQGELIAYSQKEADAVTLVHNETSTGVVNEITKIRRDFPNALLIVDAVSSIGNILNVDEMEIDGIVTASHKALAAPPGVAFVALSKRAAKKALQNTSAPYYLQFEKYFKAAQKGETPFTPAEQTIFAAASRVREINEIGINKFVAQHAAIAENFRKHVVELGFNLFPKNGAVPSNVVTAIETGKANEIIQIALENNVIFAGGQDELRGKIVRIAHMGKTNARDMLPALNALEKASEIIKEK